MSYLTSNAVLANGIETLTVPASGALTNTSVSIPGLDKTTDSIILTLNLNAEMAVAVETQPYIVAASSGSGITVALNLINSDPADATCFLSWAVFR